MLVDVPDADNGFLDIAYLTDPDYTLFEDSADRKKLLDTLAGENWDPDWVQQTLTHHNQLLADLERALQKPGFQISKPAEFDANPYLFPKFQDLHGAHRLLLLSSMSALKEGNEELALSRIDDALKCGQRFKNDANGWLITFLLGASVHHESIGLLLRLSKMKNWGQEGFKRQIELVDGIPDYEQDGFEYFVAGEFNSTLKTMSSILSPLERPLFERVESERGRVEEAKRIAVEESQTDDVSFNYLETLFPKFFIHPNRFYSIQAKSFAEQLKLTRQSCTSFNSSLNDDSGLGVTRYLMPWKAMNDFFAETSRGLLKSSRIKRCFSHVYFGVAKVVIAANAYHQQTGEWPHTLDQLVPGYLNEVPRDYFAEGPLKYNPQTRVVYSVGMNFEDDGGDSAVEFNGRCQENSPCYTNPGLSLTVQ
ncbi:MAG: hypothetical protein ACWA5Q_01885 [bacterium]